nr:immunoglobulin heavy chain junction region [Mus musculus]
SISVQDGLGRLAGL